MVMKTNLYAFLGLLLASLFGLSLHAGATAPTYSVSVGSSSFSPNPICGGMTAKATATGTLNVQNPNQEIQESGDSWGWSASVTGYAASSQAAFGAVPSGTNVPAVNAPSGSATSTVTATASQATTPGYYQVTVSATDSFTLTDSSTNPPTVTSQSQSGSTTLEITVAKVDITWAGNVITNKSNNSVYIGQGVSLSASVAPSDLNPSSYNWTIPGSGFGGDAIVAYTISNTLGAPVALTNLNGLQSQSVHFYWATSGNKSISVVS